MSHSVTRHTVDGPVQPGGSALPASRDRAPNVRTRGRRPSPTARRQRRAAFLFLAPACVMVAIYVIWPILST
ncbi:MAG: sugar ABC transporter permease, partial [Paraburkholderia graminis]